MIEEVRSFLISGRAYVDLQETFRQWLKLGEEFPKKIRKIRMRENQETPSLQEDNAKTETKMLAVYEDMPQKRRNEYAVPVPVTDSDKVRARRQSLVASV